MGTGAASSDACISCLPGTYSNETGAKCGQISFKSQLVLGSIALSNLWVHFYNFKPATNISKMCQSVSLFPLKSTAAGRTIDYFP